MLAVKASNSMHYIFQYINQIIRHLSSILLLWIADRNKLDKDKILSKQTKFMKQRGKKEEDKFSTNGGGLKWING